MSAKEKDDGARKRKRRDVAAPASSTAQDDGVAGKLECMVCRHIMFPPILKCAEGHNLCGKCCTAIMCGKSNSRKCPTCRIPLRQPIARSRNLEDWAIQVNPQVQCDFSCGARFCYASFGQHVQTCPGRTVTCPIKGCEWRGRPADLGKHLAANEPPTSGAQSSGHGLQVRVGLQKGTLFFT